MSLALWPGRRWKIGFSLAESNMEEANFKLGCERRTVG